MLSPLTWRLADLGPAAGESESHAVVMHQVGGVPRNAVSREVLGRSNDGNGNRAAERHGNHVLLNTLPQANAGDGSG